LDTILADYKKHWAVGETKHNEDVFTPIETFTQEQLQGKEIIEKNGKKFVKSTIQKT
jgi:hypothetical protein